MAKYAHVDVLDGGLNYFKNNATALLLVTGYVPLDSYATVVAKKVAEVALAPTDLLITGVDGAPRVLTSAVKSATATAGSLEADDLHFVFTDGASKILAVTDETTDQIITSGNTVNFPQLTFTANQPE